MTPRSSGDGGPPPVTGPFPDKPAQVHDTPMPEESSALRPVLSNSLLPSPPSSPPPSPSPLRNSSVPAECSTTPTAVPANPQDDDLVAKLLQFLSSATPSTLAIVAAGLAAVTYSVLGRLGLLLIGAFSGVIVFAAYESRHAELSRAIRVETGVDALQRLWTDMGNEALVRSKEQHDGDPPADDDLFRGFEDFSPETRDALNDLVDAVVRDYVKWWYDPIAPTDRSFPLACRKTLSSFLLAVSNALGRKRPADCFLDFLTNASSIIIVFLSELSVALADLPADGSVKAPDAVYKYLDANPDSSLATLLSKQQQAFKLRMVSEDLLGFLDRSASDCKPVRVFLREMLAGVCLEMTLRACSKPEWINGWIVHLLEAGEPDLNHAIDVGMQPRPDAISQAFSDVDGNVGNVGIIKSVGRPSSEEADGGRKRDPAPHQKKLSKAQEEMDEAMEEMKRMNAMIAAEEERRAQPAAEAHQTPTKQQKQQSSRIAEETGSVDPVGVVVDPTDPTAPPAFASKVPPQSQVDRKNSVQGQRSTENADKGDSRTVLIASQPAGDAAVGDAGSSNPSSERSQQPSQHFTSFDQIVPPASDEAGDEEMHKPAELTLRNAVVTVYDDASNDKGRIRSKPTGDYLIQIEPASSSHPGWMIARKYPDFETLHEILRRIAAISGATAFTEQHNTLPTWKVHTKASLRGELERYLRDACWHPALADSEGMRRFLDRDLGHQRASAKGLNWENVGKGMLDVLTTAPKGAMEGGKAVVGGVTGVFGNIGLGQLGRRSTSSVPATLSDIPAANASASGNSSRPSISTSPHAETAPYSPALSRMARDSLDSQRSSVISTQPGRIPPMDVRPSGSNGGSSSSSGGGGGGGGGMDGEQDVGPRPLYDRWESVPQSVLHSRETSRASSLAALRSASSTSLDKMRLPPPPDEMPDDYDAHLRGANPNSRSSKPREGVLGGQNSVFLHSSIIKNGVGTGTGTGAGNDTGDDNNGTGNDNGNGNGNAHDSNGSGIRSGNGNRNGNGNGNGNDNGSGPLAAGKTPTRTRQHSPLSEGETRVAVELLFAVINELYTLSSVWNIRRTLLTAAKSFLLRPGNLSLVSIQGLMQKSVLDANASDAGIAAHLRKLRENVVPTDAERAAFPAEMTDDEKAKLRARARALLIRGGVPAALTGVMGQAATGEALGRVFDSLQDEELARGLIFGIVLQAVRVVTH